ncbi:MAG: helicase-associated domain-containing protein [Treponema sp.]|jgi:hypothetical protein|nr:helicase-associated domain-containing protein [Treponema sp.]
MNKTGARSWRFRSQDEWKASILTLPDNACFDLLRSVFGNIKTPFNKHHLMENLTAFLSRREIQDTIGAYINGDDHRIIAAIMLLDEPDPAELESFFAGEYSCVELHGILLNLEERLIVYRFREEENYRISLNPLLEPVLSPFIADRSILFPSLSGGEDPGQTARYPLDDRILAALIAFVAAQGEAQKEFFKAGGGIRKKIIDDGRQIFPNLDIEVLVDGLRCIGLFGGDNVRPVPERRRLVFLGKLSFRERLEYLAAGIYADPKDRDASQNAEAGSWYFHRGRIQSLARFIRCVTGFLEYGRLYPRRTLLRLVEVLERNGGGVIRSEGRPLPPNPTDMETGRFLEAMETAGLLRAVPESPGGIAYTPRNLERETPNETLLRGTSVPPARPVIAMDTPFSCILYPEIDFSAAVTLAYFCECRETGATVRFELTRDSVVRGFNLGFTAEDMIGILERLSLNTPDQNLIWTVKDWEKRYSAVSLFQGTVLTLSEDRRYLAETGMLLPLICRTLAPGVYLLAVTGKDEAARILQKAGVDIIAQPPFVLPSDDGDTSITRSPYPPTGGFGISGPGTAVSFSAAQETPAPDPVDREKAAEKQKEKLREALRKSRLPKPDQDDLAARIERRQIVSESQLTGGMVRHEKLEARNLDYVGKTIVARQAIASGSLVEVLLPSADGEENRILGIPQALEKSGGETVLLLRPLAGDSTGREKPAPELKIPLGKISLLRWIKQSIFTQ